MDLDLVDVLLAQESRSEERAHENAITGERYLAWVVIGDEAEVFLHLDRRLYGVVKLVTDLASAKQRADVQIQ